LLTVLSTQPALAQDFTTLKGHGGPIMDIATSPTGRVATASFDNSVGLWEGRTPRWLEGHAAAVVTVAYLRDGVVLSGGDDFTLRLWDGQQSVPVVQHKGKITDIAIAPDGETVATASWDGTIGLWHMTGTGGAQGWTVTGTTHDDHDAGVNAVAFSQDGARLYSASSDGTIRVWTDGGSRSRVLASNGFAINRLVVYDAEGWLAYGAVDGVTRLIDLETGAPLADFTLDRRPILAMVHHPQTRQLAVGDGEGFIMVIDMAERRIVRDFRATRQGPVWALAFSPDGQTIYAGGLDDVAYAWPVAFLDQFDPAIDGQRSFLQRAETMPNGERQFMRKCSICHALEPGPSRKAGPTLHGVFGRQAGTALGYSYSPTLDGSGIVWDDNTIDALFDIGPDHYIPGSKMPMQVIAAPSDRADLIAFLKRATSEE
jgi:cytochrome c